MFFYEITEKTLKFLHLCAQTWDILHLMLCIRYVCKRHLTFSKRLGRQFISSKSSFK